jgi:hypothetical protein
VKNEKPILFNSQMVQAILDGINKGRVLCVDRKDHPVLPKLLKLVEYGELSCQFVDYDEQGSLIRFFKKENKMTQQTIDKLRGALECFIQCGEYMINDQYDGDKCCDSYIMMKKTAQAALKFIETDEAGKRLLQMIEGGE